MADDACPASTGEGHYPLNDRLSGQSVVGDEKAVTTQYGGGRATDCRREDSRHYAA